MARKVCPFFALMGQYLPMQRSFPPYVISALTVGLLLLGSAQAQQGTAAQTPQPPASGSSASTGQAKVPAAKKAPATAAKSATTLTLKTQKEKASYALGMNMGSSFKRQGLPVDPALVARGLRDAMTGAKGLMTEDEMKAALQQLRLDVQHAQEAKAHAEGEGNRKAGDAFLAANKAKDGVKTLPDGLQYKIVQAGNGPKPTASDTVTVNYRGTLIDGKEFDSSYKRGQPATFPVGGVIKGWTEALQMMPVGSKWQLFLPADLAYGDSPNPAIPAGSTLVFDVELLSIAPPQPQK